MLAAVLYFVTAIALLALTARFIRDLSRAAALALLLLPLCFTGRALLTGKVYGPVEMPYIFLPLRDHAAEMGATQVHDRNLFDIAFQIIPWREALRQSIAHGEWPLLNRYSASGDLLAASMQSAAYSPFTWIALIAPTVESFAFTASIAFFLAALGTFLFTRDLGASERASFVAAIAFAFSAPIAFQILWPVGFAWTLLPFVFLAVRRVVYEPSLRSMTLLTIALVLEITSGHPESLLHVTTLGAVYGLFELARVRKWRALGFAIGAGVISLLLTAIVLLPFLDATTQTIDHQIRIVWSKSPLPVVPGSPRAALVADLLPFTRTNLAARAEAGSIVIALALFGIWAARKRKETWFFLALIVVGLFLGAQAWPVSQLMHGIPPFNMSMNDRVTAAVPFCLAVLSAFAIDALSRRAAIAFLIVFAVVAYGAHHYNGAMMDPARTIADLIPLAIATVFVLSGAAAPPPPLILAALLILQRLIADATLIPTYPKETAFPRTPIFQPMLRAKGDALFRIVGTNGVLLPNTSTMYGLEDIRGTTPMTFALLDETAPLWCRGRGGAFANLYDLSRPMISMMNVRFALLYAGEGNPFPGWREVFVERHTRLLENDHYLPRAFVPHRVVYSDDLDAMNKETDFGARCYLAIDGKSGEEDNGSGAVVTKNAKLGYDLEATMQRDGWVVMSETAWRGWRAYVDGRPVKVVRANHAFLAFAVPAGHHRVRVRFLPQSFVIGRGVTLGTLILLIGCRLSLWRWRRRSASIPAIPR